MQNSFLKWMEITYWAFNPYFRPGTCLVKNLKEVKCSNEKSLGFLSFPSWHTNEVLYIIDKGSVEVWLYLFHQDLWKRCWNLTVNFYLFTRKSIYDQDNADLRAVKEMFLPDGDLYTDGQGRTRHFRWRGIDGNSQLSLFGNKEMWGEEDGIATELSTEEEIQRRKERYEREAFLREEMVWNGSLVMLYSCYCTCSRLYDPALNDYI